MLTKQADSENDSFQSNGLFVGDLSIRVRPRHLRKLFEPFGIIVKAGIREDNVNFQVSGYGFVVFESIAEAENAMTAKQGELLFGRHLRSVRFFSPITHHLLISVSILGFPLLEVTLKMWTLDQQQKFTLVSILNR